MKNILITGSSSGLGLSLATIFLKKGYNVFGLSRSTTNLNIPQVQCDFKDLTKLKSSLSSFKKVSKWDYIILNAGSLGRLDRQEDLTLEDYVNIFNVNTLANKIILDAILPCVPTQNVIGISSGAALKTYYGWSLYCVSKAAFKQLISSYAHEFPQTHFLSLAPGIIKSKMQEIIYREDEERIPSVKKFHKMYDKMDTPDEGANNIINKLHALKGYDSGSFVDIRDILE